MTDFDDLEFGNCTGCPQDFRNERALLAFSARKRLQLRAAVSVESGKVSAGSPSVIGTGIRYRRP